MKNSLRPHTISYSVLLASCSVLLLSCKDAPVNDTSAAQPKLGIKSVKIIEAAALEFRDLNKNGALDSYVSWPSSNKNNNRFMNLL